MKTQRDELAWRATLEARKVVREHNITALPVDPVAFARRLDIEVMPKDSQHQGVSGMLLRVGNAFAIAYATHINNTGFQNFSVAHELGHYFMPGHVDAVFTNGGVHESSAGFRSTDRYEMEADHFAANLLMPDSLFTRAVESAGDGLIAIEKLANLCVTSLTATAIRYMQCTRSAAAMVVSFGDRIDYCFMSDPLKEMEEIEWIKKGEGIPRNTATFAFNRDKSRVVAAERDSDTCDLRDWFGGRRSVKTTEEVIGLGNFGRTLTILIPDDIPDPEDDDDDLRESWRPKFSR